VADGAGNLYIGGNFCIVGGVIASRVAKWNGSAWSALGSGMDNTVYALAVSGTDLYAGGTFTYATNAGPSAVTVNYVAKWNGNAWSALGSGMDYKVLALAVSGTNLYAGGSFTTAGGVAANYIAKWNGSTWSALGQGMNGDVYALAVSGTDLYAGGFFTCATNAGPSAIIVNYIAKWNGTAWSALGVGMSSIVYTVAVSGTDLYAGGWFTYATNTGPSAVNVNYVAKWDGCAWSALGSGVGAIRTTPRVYALAVSGTNLYAGGEFTTAGGKVSAYAARATVSAAGGRLSSQPWSPASGFSYTFSDATAGQPYHIEASPSLGASSWTNLTNFTYTGPLTITDSSSPGVTKRFYRAVNP
jgi:hypothetical protein